ncbi:MAG: PilZ domain-containing protein, partial [Halothiobacillus sp.]|nr:PilZ domain-containing protein [Halothiobacillus sp.]
MSTDAAASKENRKYARLTLSLPGRLKISQEEYHVRIQDISLKGALIEQEHSQNGNSAALDLQKNSSGHLVIL